MKQQRDTLATGHITGAALRYDKLGRPYVDASVQLLWVDDFAQLFQQTQAREIAFTISTKAELLPLFPAIRDEATA